MMAALRLWWSRLSLRERWLVGVAGGLALTVLAVMIGRALYADYIALALEQRAAVEREGRIAAKVQLLAQAGDARAQADIPDGPVDLYLAQAASEIGLTLDRNEPRGEDQATIAIATAKAQVAIDWLAALEAQGFVIDQLTINPGANGTIGLTADLRRRGT